VLVSVRLSSLVCHTRSAVIYQRAAHLGQTCEVVIGRRSVTAHVSNVIKYIVQTTALSNRRYAKVVDIFLLKLFFIAFFHTCWEAPFMIFIQRQGLTF
jgi:hypothetical protein